LDRVIAPVVSELQLVGLAAEGEAGKLVAEADAEDRNAAKELANGADCILDRLWVAWTVGKKDAVGLQFQHVLGSGLRREYCNAAALSGEHAKDVVLDAEIIGHHMQEVATRLLLANETIAQQRVAALIATVRGVKLVDRFGRNDTGQVCTIHLADAPGFRYKSFWIGNIS